MWESRVLCGISKGGEIGKGSVLYISTIFSARHFHSGSALGRVIVGSQPFGRKVTATGSTKSWLIDFQKAA
jgi:hypothetical protein